MSKIEASTPEAAAARAAAAVSTAGTSSARPRDEPASVPRADSVELTGTARSLQQMDQELRGSGAFDARRVAELRAAIQAGTYTVDPVAVANGLASLEQLLGRK